MPNTKIIMLGGRRTGKSTILSTLIHSLNDKVSHLVKISDNTPYGASSGMDVPLHEKRIEIDNYLRNRQKFGNNSQFIVDMNRNKEEATYNLEASVQGAARIGFDFVDVPGEWMKPTHEFYPKLQKHIDESDVFVIAIDTPYLMQDENPNINTVWNRTVEITNLMSKIKIESPEDKKLILFVPVKCEKWVHEKRINEVTERLQKAYKVLINTWVSNPSVEMWVMPILTAGGLEHTRMLDAYRFFRTDKDKKGEICSVDPLTDILLLQDGKTLFRESVSAVDPEPDKTCLHSFTQIPLSWYKTTGEGFKPVHCEQIAYHLLRFLVKKEHELSQAKYQEYKAKPWYIRWFSSGGRFGRYLPVYEELVNRIPIKTTGDGFMKVESFVVTEED